MSRDIVITGKVEACPGSGGSGKATWGNIQGNIDNQTDLVNLFNTKENNDVQKIKLFFNEHPEFNYKFLQSIANQPVTDVTDYIELIFREYETHFPAALVPFNVGTMGVIVKVFTNVSGESFRVYIPKTGQIVSVSLIDASGLVKFAYSMVGDEGDTAKWGYISGNIKDQEDLGDEYMSNDDYISRAEIENLFG